MATGRLDTAPTRTDATVVPLVVEARDVTKEYDTGTRRRAVLRDVSLRLEPGRIVSVMGPSGSGKSTLLHVLGGLLAPTTGEVLVAGRPISKLAERDRAALRREVFGFVFQAFNLVSALTAEENVSLPAAIAGSSDRTGRRRALALLDEVGLDALADRRPPELSGGEQQRVALARALMLEPAVLLADEPTGNLDTAASAEVLELLVGLQRGRRLSVLIVTHDPGVAAVGEEVVLLRDGVVADRLDLGAPSLRGRRARPVEPLDRRRAVLSWLEER